MPVRGVPRRAREDGNVKAEIAAELVMVALACGLLGFVILLGRR
jgi:hypothetical protein